MTTRVLPLRQSLLISIASVIFITLLLGSGVVYWHAVNKVETEMAAAIAVGGRIARNAVDDVEEAANPKRRLELLVADFDGDRHLKAMVMNAAGNPIQESKSAVPDDPAPWWFSALLEPEKKWLEVSLPDAFSGLGTFILETQPFNEIAEAWEDTKKTLLILGILCALTMGLVYRVLGQALRPLQDLSEAVAKIGNTNNPPKIRETGPLEFVKVYRGFNQMVVRLSQIEKDNVALNEQLDTVQEEERGALARDLHDEVGPFLFAVDVDAKSLEQIASGMSDPDHIEKVKERTQRIRDAVAHMQTHVREILGRLRSPELLDMGLEHAVESLLTFWRRRRPSVQFGAIAETTTFGEKIDSVFYRIAQESISNAVRHGDPSEVHVHILKPGPTEAQIKIVDDGAGLMSEQTTKSYGISGMTERINLIGGTLSVENRLDQTGVVVRAYVPIKDPDLVTLDLDHEVSQTE